MRVLVLLLRVLLVLLLLRFLGRAVAALLRPAPSPPEIPDVDTVRDRVCNTFVPREKAITAVIGGREEHFCSPACRDRATAS